jgi:hypothetical protein
MTMYCDAIEENVRVPDELSRAGPRLVRNWRRTSDYRGESSGQMTAARIPDDLQDELDNLRRMSPDKLRLVEDVPNSFSLQWAEKILRGGASEHILPERLIACADGGVTLIFTRYRRTLVVECFNSGEVVVAKSTGPKDVTAREIALDEETVGRINREIRGFLWH